MLTSRPAEKSSAPRSILRAGVAMIFSAITMTPAFAGTVIDLSCVVGARNFNCAAQMATGGDPYIRVVPQPLGEAQKELLAARDRKWVARCHPVAERDGYGVARYRYAAPGCEYGLGSE